MNVQMNAQLKQKGIQMDALNLLILLIHPTGLEPVTF